MRLQRVATLLVTGLVLACVRVTAADAPSAPNPHPDIVSPYQAYDLPLRLFCPSPSRPVGVLLHVRINGGRPLRLVLNSAAETTVISAKAARAFGLSAESRMELVGLGSRPARVGRAETVEIGPISFRNCSVAFVEGTIAEGADGVIPLALFSDFLMRLDLPGRTLRLIPYPEEKGPEGSSNRALEQHDFLLVESVLNRKHHGYVILDTGAFCSAISREVADTLGGSRNVADLPIGAGTGPATGQLVSADVHFEIAGQEFVPDRVVALDLLNLSRHYGVEVVGVVGFPDLSPYVLTVDYRNRSVKIEPKLNASPRERGHRENPHTPLAFR